ncbi:MAG TPA: flavin reductase family protein [Candidatus Methylomirabilis sp.]
MDKISIKTNAFLYPMPVTLVGTLIAGRPNFMAVGWIARVNLDPPLIAMGLNKRHSTPSAIQENQAFSVNIPSKDLMEATDYCGLVSGKEVDKSGLFEVFYGELKAAPLIKACPLCLECRLIQTITLPTHYLFLGEIVGAYTEERYLTEGKPDIRKMNPFVLTMPDNNYWVVGEHAGKAWSLGNRLKGEGDKKEER